MRKLIGVLLVLIVISIPLIAQPTGGGPGNGGDPDVPIDGAIGLLIAGGAYLGIRKLQGFRKKKD